jgi:hypothetical protein
MNAKNKQNIVKKINPKKKEWRVIQIAEINKYLVTPINKDLEVKNLSQ